MTDNAQLTEIQYFEKMVLSRALQYPQQRKHLRLYPKHFHDDRHGEIYAKLSNDLGFTSEDLLTESIKSPHKYGNYEFIRSITEFPVSSERGIVNDQLQIYQFYKERATRQLMQEYMAAPDDEKALEISAEIQRLEKFDLQGNDSKINTLAEIMDDLHGVSKQTIVETGFRQLDDIINGFEMQQLNVVAARPSAGKTAFALGMAKNLTDKGAQVIVCSLETTEKSITQRLLASMAKVDLYKLKKPVDRMSGEEIQRVIDAMDIYNKMPLKIEADGSFTPGRIRRIINNASEHEPVFILIDYLQLMTSEQRHNSDFEEVSHISRELKRIVQESKNVTIIALSQLSRGVESRNDKRPVMSDLRQSGQIEQDANIVMTLYRDDYYNPPDNIDPKAPSPLEVIVVKNKDGGLGTAQLEFYKQIQKIY